MANFNTILSNIWEDNKFRKLTDSKSKLLFIHAFSNPRCPISGIYKISIETMAFETGVDQHGCEKSLREVISVGLVSYDYEKNVIWVHGKIKHDKSWTTKQRVKSIQRSLGEFSKCSFMQSFFSLYPFLIDLAIEEEQKEKELRGCKAPEEESPLEAGGASASEKDGSG